MTSPRSFGVEAERSRLRATVARIESELSGLPRKAAAGDGNAPTSALAAAWADLVEQLALGPEPELRECPVCGHVGMRAATLCGYCWTKMTPAAKSNGAVG